MTEQQIILAASVPAEEKTATMCKTKAGYGFKFVVDGVWYYTSKAQVMDMIEGRSKACTFHTIVDDA